MSTNKPYNKMYTVFQSYLKTNLSYITSNITCGVKFIFCHNSIRQNKKILCSQFIDQKVIVGHQVVRVSNFRYDARNENKTNASKVNLRTKILYNSMLDENIMKSSWLKRKIQLEKNSNPYIEEKYVDTPISLKYINSTNIHVDAVVTNTPETNEDVHLPYNSLTNKLPINEAQTLNKNSTSQVQNIGGQNDWIEPSDCLRHELSHDESRNWMMDYEPYNDDEAVDSGSADKPWQLNYGTPDIRVSISKVACGGCGAFLHCQDTAIPGYLPSELFIHKNSSELRLMRCQRCHFMEHYNMALNVSVSPDDYPRLLAQIQDKWALVILMVDLMDFPCSIWPGIIDIIGTKRPVVVVGNKVDLLPQDCSVFLSHIQICLANSVKRSGVSCANIRHVALVSAKTGYGVEELITKLHNLWDYKGDVYLIGCTNVGKSTLFNALLQSDYCKVQAVDLVQRATTSQWPGTTLNLLKFPILRPAGWLLYMRVQRLLREREGKMAERKLREHQLKTSRNIVHATLIGHIGRTFRDDVTGDEEPDPFTIQVSGQNVQSQWIGLDPKDKRFKESCWCYDTPGTVQPDQVLNLLTTEELMLTLPKRLLEPRTFRLRPGLTLMVAGLARLDFHEGDGPIMLTVFASDKLPITVCMTEDANELYNHLTGTKILQVPSGGPERMAQWPGLSVHPKLLQVVGKGWKESAADIVLSSTAWVAVTSGKDSTCQFWAWTPHGRGVYLRDPALLRYSVNLRGAKVRGSPQYRNGRAVFVKN